MEKSKLNFWEQLKRPFFIMAPMADVTDSVFRQIIAENGKPDVMYTEFVSADGLMHPEAQKKLLFNLDFTENQRPIVAQIFSGKPEKIEGASRLCKELGFDGIDINMGCPDSGVEKQGAGAAMIKNFENAQACIRAAQKGADGLPVSIKTRLGYKSIDEFENWFNAILETEPACIIVHLRTRKEMSKVQAHWEIAEHLSELRDKAGVKTLVSANGDVKNIDEAIQKANDYNLDGIMLGRAIFGNPWLFSKRNPEDISWKARIEVILKHTRLFEDKYILEPQKKGLKPYKNFHIMRKFYGAYVENFPKYVLQTLGYNSLKSLKMQLMKCENYDEIAEIFSKTSAQQ